MSLSKSFLIIAFCLFLGSACRRSPPDTRVGTTGQAPPRLERVTQVFRPLTPASGPSMQPIEPPRDQTRPTISAVEGMQEGLIAYQRGDMEGCIRHLQQASETAPENDMVLALLGSCHRAMGNLSEAEALFDWALAVSPQSAFLYSERGITRRNRGNLAGAFEDLQQANQMEPNHVFRYNLGLVLGDLNRYAEAVTAYTTAIELADAEGQPDPDYYTDRARVRLMAGRGRAALADVDQALQLAARLGVCALTGPGGIEYNQTAIGRQHGQGCARHYTVRGDVLRALRRFSDAEAAYTTALQVEPEYRAAYLGRALARNEQGDVEGAHQDVERAQRAENPATARGVAP